MKQKRSLSLFARSLLWALLVSPLSCSSGRSADNAPDEEIPAPRSVLMDVNGDLRPYNEQGDTIPDFSAVGYRNGERDRREGWDDLPVIEVYPNGEDNDAARINTAIAKAAALPPLEDGYRAVVQLAGGRYGLEDTVYIRASGIILAGPEAGERAILEYLPRKQGVALRIGDGSSPEMNRGKSVQVTADYVPVGSRRIPVEDASAFSPGDRVIVEHAHNDAWISELGMDRIPPNWQNSGGQRVDLTQQWQAKDYVYPALRVVEAIEGDVLVLDAPTVMPLDRRFGKTVVGPYTHENLIENIGVAHLTFVSAYDASLTAPNQFYVDPDEPDFIDEAHGAWAITVGAARNGWIHDVVARHFSQGCVHLNRHSSHFTVSDSKNLDPVSKVVGGRRYSFALSGQRHLVKNCYSRKGRHDFVTHSRVVGPSVFYNCLAEDAFNGSEPHHRMSFGILYDNVRVWGPGACLAVLNRGNNGTGHGWMGAQIVFWNSASPIVVAQKPPLGQNFAIGVSESHDRTTDQFRKNLDRRLILTNAKSGKTFEFDGGPFIGDGHFESPDAPVYPLSLYKSQLEERLKERE